MDKLLLETGDSTLLEDGSTSSLLLEDSSIVRPVVRGKVTLISGRPSITIMTPLEKLIADQRTLTDIIVPSKGGENA